MRYLFAFFIPPLAVFMCHRPVHGVLNLLVWLISVPLILILGLGLLGWILCTVHALICCRLSSVDKRLNRLIGAIERPASAPALQSK